MSKLVGLTAGHYANDTGAVAAINGDRSQLITENIKTIITLGHAMSYLGDHGIYPVSPTGKLSAKITELNRYPLICAVEIHYNSAGVSTPHGVEAIYHPGSVKGKDLAERIYNKLIALDFLTPRRIMDTNELGRRLAFTREVAAPAVIIEPLWLSNPQELEEVAIDTSRLKMIGETIGSAIVDFVNSSIDNR